MAEMRVHIVRPDDLLFCELEFTEARTTGEPPQRRLIFRSGARVILHLPPQHVAEQAYPGMAQVGHYGSVVPSRASGPSRLVFQVPTGTSSIAYRLDAILALLNTCTLAVPESAVRPPDTSGPRGCFHSFGFYWNPPKLTEPNPTETAIEFPLRLILSPDELAGFAHATAPVIDPVGNRIELWHTRLQIQPETAGGREMQPGRRVRAVWMRQGDGPAWDSENPEWPEHAGAVDPEGSAEPFSLNTMTQRNRHEIVHVSANHSYTKQTRKNYRAGPVEVQHLALTSLGAWLRSRGDWRPPANDLIEWSHRSTQGRDHYVRIIEQGFLYPFGHAASLFKITERKFGPLPDDPPLLRQRLFIIVRQPECGYAPEDAPDPAPDTMPLHHTMPMRTITLHTVTTPDLVIEDPPTGLRETSGCYLIRAAATGDPVLFSCIGTDVEGNTIDLVTPLVWMRLTSSVQPSSILDAQDIYHRAQQPGLAVDGRPLALTPTPPPGPAGDTTYPTSQVTFTARPASESDRTPGFWPELVTADVRAPALEMLSNLAEPVTVAYPDRYRAHGLAGENRHQVIAQRVQPLSARFDQTTGAPVFDPPGQLDLNFGAHPESVGAVLRPDLRITGLSRRLGPVGGSVDNAGAGVFDPAAFFSSTAKLLGIIDFADVLTGYETAAPPSVLPRLVTEGGPDTLRVRYAWTPELKNDSVPPRFVGEEASMKVDVVVDARTSDPPESDVTATLDKVRMNLPALVVDDDVLNLIELHFERIEFRLPAGRTPDISVQFDRVVFTGPLSFVEALRTVIPMDGFSDPPALEVTDQGITSRFALAIPTLAVGVFSLQNLALRAGFALPFREGPLTVSFAFCARQEPFLLTVSMFGGGGFFGITVDPAGVAELEAAFEFGANVAIDLGVAQGGVHVMAGVYFRFSSTGEDTLIGYFRLGGNMSVLGLISASIELTLEFSYLPDAKATGRAELEVEIDIFLFSFSVTVECERTFAGSDSDPTFAALMGPYTEPGRDVTVRPWTQYCHAYA